MAPLGDEEPRKVVLTLGEPSTKGAQFVAGDRLFDGQAVLEPGDPKPGLGKINVGTAERDGFGDPEAVAIHHEDQQVVTDPVAALFGCLEQRVDFGLAKKITPSLVGLFTFRRLGMIST